MEQEVNIQIRKIALNDKHESLGAKMVNFAGYSMPIQYSGLIDEHLCVRNSVGVFDVSHMGEFVVKGPGAKDLVQTLTSNDVTQLYPGRVQYSCFPNESMGIVDDLLVYMFNEEEYMMVVNASNIDKDMSWIQSHNPNHVEVIDQSNATALLAVQGPDATAVLQKLTAENLSDVKYYHFIEGEFAGVKNVLISATGYTGAGGFEIYCRNEDAEIIWDAVFEAGEDFGIKPIGLAARDTLRLEMGFCLYGNDINDTTAPHEAGLGWITKFSTEFINKQNLLSQKENGLSRKLVGFELIERGIPRQHYPIKNEAGELIGEVTSGTMSPSLQKGIGMGYVAIDHSKINSKIFIEIRNKLIPAEVVSLPFYKGK